MKSSEEIVEKLEKEISIFRANISGAKLIDLDIKIAAQGAICFAQGVIDWIKSEKENEPKP